MCLGVFCSPSLSSPPFPPSFPLPLLRCPFLALMRRHRPRPLPLVLRAPAFPSAEATLPPRFLRLVRSAFATVVPSLLSSSPSSFPLSSFLSFLGWALLWGPPRILTRYFLGRPACRPFSRVVLPRALRCMPSPPLGGTCFAFFCVPCVAWLCVGICPVPR